MRLATNPTTRLQVLRSDLKIHATKNLGFPSALHPPVAPAIVTFLREDATLCFLLELFIGFGEIWRMIYCWTPFQYMPPAFIDHCDVLVALVSVRYV